MKRSSILFAAVVTLGALAIGCAGVRIGDPSTMPVRVTRNESEVAGCQMISRLRAGAGSAKEVQAELENLTRSRDGNTLLMSEGEPSSGVAYRCTGAPTTPSEPAAR